MSGRDHPLTRRRFCGSVAGGAAAVACSGIAAGCGNGVAAAPALTAALDEDRQSPTYGKVAVEHARFVDLAPVGGAVTVLLSPLRTQPPFLVPEGGLLLVHRGPAGAADEYIATQSLCRHAGCPLGYSAERMRIECPCHASQFRAVADPADPTSHVGQLMHLPARSDLMVWRATVSGALVYIDLTKRVGGRALPAVANQKLVLTISDFPELAVVGGSLSGQPAGLADVLIIVRTGAGSVIAVSAICTHAACDVIWAPGSGLLECPCHGSTFAQNGSVQRGPATRPLRSYPVTFDGTTLTIQVA